MSDIDDLQEESMVFDESSVADALGDDFEDEEIEIIPVDECGIEDQSDEEEDQVAKLCKDADESRDEYLRLYAEFDNYKKRTAKDKAELARYANESILNELLTSVDNLEIALKHADEEETKKAFMEGVEMTLRELYRTFEKFGVTPIKAEGEPFDPEFHHAVAHIESDDVDEGMVVAELRKGFMYNDKLLRASMVSVSKKPSGQEPDEENNT